MKKSKSNILRNLLIGIGVFVLLIVLALGYMGFMPGVSAIFGSSTPKDLGVRYTAQDFKNVQAIMGGNLQVLPADTPSNNSIQYFGLKHVSVSFSNEELTAIANNGKWKYRPTRDVQIKISPNGTVEMSGIIIKDNVGTVAQVYGYTADDLKSAESAIGFIPGNPTFYVKGTASVVNNQISINIDELQIGKIDAKNLITSDQAQSIIDNGISNVPGLNIQSLTFSDGKLNFNGTMPESVSRVVK